jgi:hypothetical protein
MPSINRATLPQNFLDSVTSGMRLPQPEPQYWFARAALAGRLRAAAINAGAATIQQFVSMSGAGDKLPPDLDSLIRAGDGYPDAVLTVDKFGLGQGDVLKLRRPIFEGGGYDLASRRVVPDKATSTTGQSIKAEEVPMVLEEYEGPYNVAAGEVRPYGIRDFDAKYKANRDELASLTTMHLNRDIVKFKDTVIRDLFRATPNITYANGVTNVLSMTSGAGNQANLEMILQARKQVSDREWRPFSNGRYTALVPTKFNVDMVGDPDYRALSAQHGGGKNQLFGYIASIQDVDIFEVTTLKQYAPGETVPGDGNAVPAGVTVQEGLLFGPGCVGFGTGMEPNAFWADDTNYGKEAKVIWRAIEAYQTLDNRGIQRFLFQ